MKAHRTCVCGLTVHVRKNPCDCGHLFPKKGEAAPVVVTKVTTKVAASEVRATGSPKETKVATPLSSPANVTHAPVFTENQADRIVQLQNHISDLEKTMEKREKVWEDRLKAMETRQAKFYNFQGQLLYQRAWEKIGGKGDLYHSREHGDNPKMFKEHADETGVFILPVISDLSAAFPDGPSSDEAIQATAEIMLTDRATQERDLKGDGVVIEDVMSFAYATPVEKDKEEVKTPTLQNAIDQVKFLTGEAQ